VDVPRASIPAITFVIPANLPARCHQGKSSRLFESLMGAVKARSNKGAIHSSALLQVIRNYNRERIGCC
jgi:hypothetical protein